MDEGYRTLGTALEIVRKEFELKDGMISDLETRMAVIQNQNRNLIAEVTALAAANHGLMLQNIELRKPGAGIRVNAVGYSGDPDVN